MSKTLNKHLSRFEEFLELPPPEVSFEFFPPKDDEAEQVLWNTIKELEALQPKFVSVTYGAGGSTRERTYNTVKRIRDETSLTPAVHLTCVGASRGEIDDIAREYWDSGIKHIVALRGDPPEDAGQAGKYIPHPDGYAYCADLVKGLKNIADFEISVACFPEVHPEAESAEKDLEYLKQKTDIGVDRAITQLFFDTGLFLDFRDKAAAAGVNVPIIPGIPLVSNFSMFLNFCKKCQATVPEWVHNLLGGIDNNPKMRNIVSAMIAAEQCRILREEGVDHFHFYTLNRPLLVSAVCHILGVRRKL